MTTPKRKRPKPYSYRPPKDKDQALKQMIEDSGLSFNAFVTEAIFGRSRHRPAETRLLARVLGQCGVMTDRLREVMLAGPDNAVLLLEEIRNELRLIRTALMRLLGRRS